ncbi:mitochondrial cardiolipin hydrolase [Cephus cinctus]|uniref:Mitochondrial cardiolipin hydrolase n=1 Tax=Cephus cinctus TaxID=211228 RepID=A0AAJ7RB87_CEPCN|nr:mitochondrial cardiolipin hydrolase [Cephus cinctus]
MTINNVVKTTAIIVTGAVVSEFVWQLYKRHRDAAKSETAVHEVLFFSEESALCRPHVNTRIPCRKPNCAVAALQRIIAHLNSSKKTLDICVYLMTCEDLARAVVNAHKRNVTIRIILDATMAENNGGRNPILMFHKAGISLRLKRSPYMMHHKFAIVDGSLLLTGSLNWTMQALNGNFDNMIVTNEKKIVEPFVREFSKIWLSLNANNEKN